MSRFIHFSHPDQGRDCQHQGVIPEDAIRRDNTSQKRERARDPNTNINLDISDVQLTDATAVGTGTVASSQLTWLGGMSGNSFSRVSPSLLDPFDTLCESPERLRQLLRQRMARDPRKPHTKLNR
jgi:hypothetical protein